MVPGWIVGPVVSTLALVCLAVVWVGIFASGGGLILAALAAILGGSVAAVRVDGRHRGRDAAITTLYVTGLLAAYLAFIESRPLPPGMSRGGATVPMPQQQVGVRADFAHLAEGTTAVARSRPIRAGYRMFSVPDVGAACDGSRAGSVVRLEADPSIVNPRVGQPFPLNSLSVVAVDSSGAILPNVPVAIESEMRSTLLDVRSDRVAEGRVTPLQPGVTLLRVRTICEGGRGAELFLTAVIGPAGTTRP